MRYFSPVFRLVLYFVAGVLLGVFAFSRFASAATSSTTYLAYFLVQGPVSNVTVQGKSAASAEFDTLAQQFVGQNIDGCGIALSVSRKGSEVWSSTLSSGSQEYNATCAGPAVSPAGYVLADESCPNGGTYGTQYPGWCIVGGQPPPVSGTATPAACQQLQSVIDENGLGLWPQQYGAPGEPSLSSLPSAGAPGVYDPSNSFVSGGNDPYSGCGLIEVGPRLPVTVSGVHTVTVFYKASGSVATGTLSTDGQLVNNVAPQVVACGSFDFCLDGSQILAQPGTAADDSQATINGQPISVPSSIPDGTCVSLNSGGAFCAADALQPNNGASPPAPAAPDGQVVTTGVGGSTVTDNYYSSTTVALSSNFGNGQPSTSAGSSTTTTCTTSGGTKTCASSSATTAAKSATTYATPVFPGGTSVNAAIAGAASAISSSPLVSAAAGAIAQTVPAGSCPDWSFHSVLFNQTFDFSNGSAGICTLASDWGPTLAAVFAAMWVVLGAIIILSA